MWKGLSHITFFRNPDFVLWQIPFYLQIFYGPEKFRSSLTRSSNIWIHLQNIEINVFRCPQKKWNRPEAFFLKNLKLSSNILKVVENVPTSTTTKVAVFLRKFGKFCLNSQEFTRIQSNSQKFIVKFLNLCVCHVSLERFAQSANKNFQAKYFFTLKSNN